MPLETNTFPRRTSVTSLFPFPHVVPSTARESHPSRGVETEPPVPGGSVPEGRGIWRTRMLIINLAACRCVGPT
jgi:hypothetical protein